VNQFRPGTPQSSSSSLASAHGDLEADLRIMARLEGKPLPTTMELAQLFGVSPTTAFRMLTRIRRNGMLKLVDRIRPPEHVCHGIVDLRTRLADAEDLRRLEARLAADPHVSRAAAVTGKHSYRITLMHANAAEANGWFKAILAEPAVIDGVLRFCRLIIDRQSDASALVGEGAGKAVEPV
jgi:DNA-binding FadR family transcriptional regulator